MGSEEVLVEGMVMVEEDLGEFVGCIEIGLINLGVIILRRVEYELRERRV